MPDMTQSMVEFAALLRAECGIPVGHGHAHEALRAMEVTGIGSRERLRYALRPVFCSKPGHLEPFDRAFDTFFGNAARGMRQPRHARTQPRDDDAGSALGFRSEIESEAPDERAAGVLKARFSAVASAARASAVVSPDETARLCALADRLVRALHLGRSRRFSPAPHGERFDLRRTLRASLQTGGEPAHVRRLGPSRRNPRIAIVIDGSRSMSEHAPLLLQFARVLCLRSSRVRAFVFSTGLREITKELRNTRDGDAGLEFTGEVWGGGTRIGTALETLERRFRSAVDANALAVIASDGLDVGETAQVREFMRRLHRRAAGVIWLNPHARMPEFKPEAKGMEAALPYVDALLDMRDLEGLASAARHVRR